MEPRQVLFVYNPARPGAGPAVDRGLSWCRREGVPAQAHAPGSEVADDVGLVVAVGGDGTLLRAAALVYPREVPILGVNAGGLGFLAACDAAGIEGALEAVVRGRARLERRTRLSVRGPGVERTALNDLVVAGTDAAPFTALDVWVDGERALSLEGDGLVVATPTGSTAYALAAGGPVLHPFVGALVLVPLAPHTLGTRPVVLPRGSEVVVRLQDPGRLFVDGSTVGDVRPGDEVRAAAAPAETVLARLEGTEPFFSRLREKLGWSG